MSDFKDPFINDSKYRNYSAVAQLSGATKSDLNIWITIDCSGKVCGMTWTQPNIIAMVKGYPLEKLDFSGNNRL